MLAEPLFPLICPNCSNQSSVRHHVELEQLALNQWAPPNSPEAVLRAIINGINSGVTTQLITFDRDLSNIKVIDLRLASVICRLSLFIFVFVDFTRIRLASTWPLNTSFIVCASQVYEQAKNWWRVLLAHYQAGWLFCKLFQHYHALWSSHTRYVLYCFRP